MTDNKIYWFLWIKPFLQFLHPRRYLSRVHKKYMIPHPCRHFEWRCDLFCSRHYKSNKSYCTVERRNGRYRIFEWFFDRPSRPVIARVLRAIRNEWLKTRNCARFISERAEITYDTHVCTCVDTGGGGRGKERRESWEFFPEWRCNCFRMTR